jgi:hypothetical protein
VYAKADAVAFDEEFLENIVAVSTGERRERGKEVCQAVDEVFGEDLGTCCAPDVVVLRVDFDGSVDCALAL